MRGRKITRKDLIKNPAEEIVVAVIILLILVCSIVIYEPTDPKEPTVLQLFCLSCFFSFF